MPKSSSPPLPEFRLTTVTTSPFEPRRRSKTFEQNAPLRRVRRHLERNIGRRVTLAESAGVAGFERTYFSSYFHQKVGITYVRWMNAVRIAHAIELLRTSNAKIGVISKTVGYSDLRTFERNFARLTGQTPSDFRSQAQSRLTMEGTAEEQTAQTAEGEEAGDRAKTWFDPESWSIPSG